ncbi:MAG TPA: hypothetical protein VIV14_10950 [Gammaproteobacteria bacterium]
MKHKFVPAAEPAEEMNPIHDFRWYSKARVRLVLPGQPDSLIRLPGEWHGKTREEAESRAVRAAHDWINGRYSD